ncbi:hypothetical protein ACIRPH_30855 [Nocardiopsis sp. NPDC101807]|uniref:hypothetical protein n=1 Tax=Nocardiopsis sp. NPDC101807 TaxID=3364339 RepID=UPI0038135879
MTEFYADMHGGEEVTPGAIAAAETALEGVAVYETPEELVEEIERLKSELTEADAAAEFNWNSYQNAITWHLAMAREIVRRGGTIPKDAPDLPETVAHLAKIHGADQVRAALDSL